MKVKEFLKKHKKWCIVAVVLAVVLVGAGSFVSRAKKVKKMSAMVPAHATAEVERRSLMETVSATGTVVSVQSKNVSVNLSGVEVMEVNVKVGDSVAAGDVICVLDSTDLEEDLADAKTTLNATSGKTAIEMASAERGLSEAQTTRDIEITRAYEDEDEAYNDYLWAKTDEEEAEDEYREAQEAAVIKNGEWEAAQADQDDLEEELEDAEEAMETAKNKMEKLAAVAGVDTAGSGRTSSSYASEFASEVSSIQNVISSNAGSASLDAASHLYIENDALSSYQVTDFVSSDADETIKNEIDSSLGTLVGLQTAYLTAQAEEENRAAYEEAYAAYEKAYAYYQEVLAEYKEVQTEVSSWESKYNSAKNSESSYENAYESAIKNTDSYYDAYEQKVRSTEDTIRNNDSTVSNKEDSLATSQLSAATADLSEKQQIRQLEEQIEDCTVTAPISGVITSLNVEEGDTYSSANSAIAVIENTAGYEVEAEIDEYDISLIEVGQQVVVKTNGTGDKELDGTVTEVAPRASSDSSSDVSYKITVSIDTPCDDLRLDMTAKLSIIIESKDDVLTVPYDAVQEAEDGTYYVEVTDRNTTFPGTDNTVAVTEENSAGETGQKVGEVGQETGDTQAENTGKDTRTENPGNDTAQDGMPQRGMDGGEDNGVNTLASRKVTVEKGIESDYYIEVISDEITEGMQVIVQSSDDSGDDFRGMVGMQGPMGGF